MNRKEILELLDTELDKDPNHDIHVVIAKIELETNIDATTLLNIYDNE